MFAEMKLRNWQQFGAVELSFHDHLTILTGANGAGKTTILNILATHFNWQSNFVGEFIEDELSKTHNFSNSFREIESEIADIAIPEPQAPPRHSYTKVAPKTDIIGEIVYANADSDHQPHNILIPKEGIGPTYTPTVDNMKTVKGIYIHSQRPLFQYKEVKNIPTSAINRAMIYNEYFAIERLKHSDNFDNKERTATSSIKESLIALAVFGEGNKHIRPNEESKELFEGFLELLKNILPPKIGFEAVKIVPPEVVFVTNTGEFLLDAVSGGVASIMSIAWEIYMYADPNEQFVVLIDEPENHLHPELQKTFMSNLIKSFPNVQFIVVTHNPLIISAVKDSRIYVLDYTFDEISHQEVPSNDSSSDIIKRVYSRELDFVNKAGTSNEILSSALGIDSTIPQWADEKIREIIERYSALEFTTDVLSGLKAELNEYGLGSRIPSTIAEVSKNK